MKSNADRSLRQIEINQIHGDFVFAKGRKQEHKQQQSDLKDHDHHDLAVKNTGKKSVRHKLSEN